MTPLDLQRAARALDSTDSVQVEGRVQGIVGPAIHAALPGARLGELVHIDRPGGGPLLAEIVGFQDDRATLLPLGDPSGIGPDDAIHVTGQPLKITFSDALLGRVLDGLGRPLDGGPALQGTAWDVMRAVPNPMQRPRIDQRLPLGIRAIDAFTALGEGQRVGLFSGSGVGKSSLLGQIARQAAADVFVVCLVGERGREVVEFVEDALGEAGRQRGVVVCATSDEPALLRVKSAFVATAIAEGFREQGKRVLLLVDSMTRFARAAREVGLAAGETPARRGYPPSVFALLPTLLERAGNTPEGSITAFYTVLVEGDDMEEPVADEIRGICDAHIVLSRALAERGRWPAVDVLASLSRVMPRLVLPEHLQAAQRVREHLACYEAKRDLVLLGAYESGADPRLDAALARIDAIEAFLRQRTDETADPESALAALETLV